MDSVPPFENVLLCEDVREEINHKRIIIGVFTDEVVVSAFPAHLNLSFYLEFVAQRTGSHKIRFSITVGDEEKEVATLIIDAESTKIGARSAIPFPKFRIAATSDTQLNLYVTVDGGDRQKLLSKRIRKGSVAS